MIASQPGARSHAALHSAIVLMSGTALPGGSSTSWAPWPPHQQLKPGLCSHVAAAAAEAAALAGSADATAGPASTADATDATADPASDCGRGPAERRLAGQSAHGAGSSPSAHQALPSHSNSAHHSAHSVGAARNAGVHRSSKRQRCV
eukprot:5503906-Prymnesium_polylepis.1